MAVMLEFGSEIKAMMPYNTASMCQNYFGLTEAPFSIAPDPRYLYMSRRHQEALATLLFGISGDGGFVLLTGDVGAGKTTICRCLLEQVPASCDVAYIFNPKLTVVELLSTICDEFGIAYPPANTSIKLFVDLINAYLLDANAKGRRAVLIIDEAQNLSADVLEQMRLLTNLETHQRKLLQIILLGQPELAAMLERPELRQLAQRIVARYHLGPLTKEEVASYVRYRLEVAGTQRQLFPNSLMGKLHSLSSGVPRIINVLCDRALLGAYVQGNERVDRATLKRAAREVAHPQRAPRKNALTMLFVGVILIAGIALAAAFYRQNPQASKAAPEIAAVQAIAAAPYKSAAPATPTIPEPTAILPAALEWPADVPLSSSKTFAYNALFQTWGAGYREGIDICSQAASVDLSCRTGRGGLGELRQWNKPAILHMHDNHGQGFYAALTGLDDRAATFAVGNGTRTVALGALARQWCGRYTLLWRPTPGIHGSARLGTHSPDGVPGPQTLVRPSAAADRAAPKLLAMHGEG